jgi:hypothetical protein
MNVEQRLRRLETGGRKGFTGYRLPDGQWRYIRTSTLLDACHEVAKGVDTPRARLLLTATASTDNRLHELAQALAHRLMCAPTR